MSVASIETTLELWASSLRDVKARMRGLFKQERMAVSAGLFLDGLLGEERRQTGWLRAEAAGDPGPWRQQSVLGRGQWNADALRDIVRGYAVETLGAADAVLVIDETGFLKQGKRSCGVGRQYTGSAGKITNCHVGVFAAYVSRHGHAFIDRALYLAKAWTDDPPRLASAHVPSDVGFATKPRIAVQMIRRALAAGVPFSWLAADTVYGVAEVEQVLRQAGKGYVLGVAGRAGTKGPRLHEWCYVEGRRWSIEDSFETTKNELGLDHNETRSWHGWHRHVALVMLAFAMMAAIRQRANATGKTPKKTLPPRVPQQKAWCDGQSRRSGA